MYSIIHAEPVSPYCYSSVSSTSLEKHVEGSDHIDRFIPSRKMLRPDYLSVKEVETRQQTKVTSTDDLLPDLYRRYVMEDCSSPVRSTTSIESFENCNLLRYG